MSEADGASQVYGTLATTPQQTPQAGAGQYGESSPQILQAHMPMMNSAAGVPMQMAAMMGQHHMAMSPMDQYGFGMMNPMMQHNAMQRPAAMGCHLSGSSFGTPVGPPTISMAAVHPTVLPGRGQYVVEKRRTADEVEADQLRKTLPVSLQMNKGVCTNYVAFGAVWKHGQKKTLPRKIKIVAIRYLNPKIWSPMRLSLLGETLIDMLLFILTGVKPHMNPRDMGVPTKLQLMDMLLDQHKVIADSNSERVAKLSVDLSNIEAVALEYGYPVKFIPPGGVENEQFEGDDEAPTPPTSKLKKSGSTTRFPGTTVRIEALEDDDSDLNVDLKVEGSEGEEDEAIPQKPAARKRACPPVPREAGKRPKQSRLPGVVVRAPKPQTNGGPMVAAQPSPAHAETGRVALPEVDKSSPATTVEAATEMIASMDPEQIKLMLEALGKKRAGAAQQ